MTTPIDLSKYAKGRRLKCVEGCPGQLTKGHEYESDGQDSSLTVSIVCEDDGNHGSRFFSRFVPAEDEAPACLCQSDRGPRSCPEHGARCADPDCDKLCDGVNAWVHMGDKRYDYCSPECHHKMRPGFAPPVAASPKVEKPREWDQAKYNGLDAGTYQQLSTLDKRIAVARAELDTSTADRMKRMAGPGHPHEGHSDRVTNYRRWGQS